MARHRPRHAAAGRALAAVLRPVLTVVLALSVALGLALVLTLGVALRASGDRAQPRVELAGDTSDPSAGEPLPSSAPVESTGEGTDPAPEPAPGADLPGDPAPEPAEPTGTALATVADAAARAGGTVHVVVRGAGDRVEVADPGADRPVYTASLVKLLVVQQLFAREDVGLLALSDTDRRLMERAVTTSDDDAMNTLWDRFGGADLVAGAVADFGLSGSTPPATPGQWGEAHTTARDVAVFLSTLGDHLAADDLATFTGWMRAPAPVAGDGFDQRWGLLSPAVPAGTGVAAKQGWMCCVDGRRQLHSAGTLADGRTVVLLGDFPASTSWASAEEALDSAARAVVTSAG